jgi:hypothetical protein
MVSRTSCKTSAYGIQSAEMTSYWAKTHVETIQLKLSGNSRLQTHSVQFNKWFYLLPSPYRFFTYRASVAASANLIFVTAGGATAAASLTYITWYSCERQHARPFLCARRIQLAKMSTMSIATQFSAAHSILHKKYHRKFNSPQRLFDSAALFPFISTC